MSFFLTILERLSLRAKLAIGFGALLLLTALVGGFALDTESRLNDHMQHAYEVDLLGVASAKDTQIHHARMDRSLHQALLSPDDAQRAPALRQLLDAQLALDQEILKLEPRTAQTEAHKSLERVINDYSVYRLYVDEAVGLLRQNKVAQAVALVNSTTFLSSSTATASSIATLIRVKQDQAHDTALTAQRLATERGQLTYGLLGLAAGLGLLLVWVISLSVVQPVNRLRLAVQHLAKGQLNTSIPHTDFHNETGNLARSIQVLQQGALDMEDQSWLKLNLSQIGGALRAVGSFSELSQCLFSSLAPIITIGHGAFYIFEEETRRLRLLGGYANQQRKSLGRKCLRASAAN